MFTLILWLLIVTPDKGYQTVKIEQKYDNGLKCAAEAADWQKKAISAKCVRDKYLGI